MKILYIITQGENGGGQKHVLDLALGMQKKGYEIFVATGKIENENDAWLNLELQKNGIKKENLFEIKDLQREINFLKDIKSTFEIVKLLKKINPDILHLHSSKVGFVGSLTGFLYKIFSGKLKIIYTVHGFVFLEPMNFLKKYFYIFLEFVSSFFRNFTIIISKKDLKIGKKFFILRSVKKFKLIYNGLDENLQKEILIKDESRKFIFEKIEKNIDQDFSETKIIGTIANFYNTKGLEFLIDSAKKVVDKNPKTIFVVFGFGEESFRKKLENLIQKNNLEKKFFLLGKVTNAFQYLKALDIFALTSVKEGLPYSLLEARLANLPIVATKVGGIPEMEENFEINLVDSRNVEQIANKILEILNNPEKFSVENNFPKIYSLENMINETEEIYKNIL